MIGAGFTKQREALAQSFAKSLGVEEAKVITALKELRTEAKAVRSTELKSKLDSAVNDGTLTQAEAVIKANERA